MLTPETPPPAARAVGTPSPEAVLVCAVAEKSGVDEAVVRTFAKISAPENSAVFSAASAATAFLHVKVERS